MFRQGFDTRPIGMVLTDPESGRYARVNDAMCALLDRPREELIGASVDSVTHPDDRSAGLDRRQALIDGSLASAQSEMRLYARTECGLGDINTAPVYQHRWVDASVVFSGDRHHRAQGARGTV